MGTQRVLCEIEELLALLNQAPGSLGTGKMGMLGCSLGLLGSLLNTFFLDLYLCLIRMGCVLHPPPPEWLGPSRGVYCGTEGWGGGSGDSQSAVFLFSPPAKRALPHAPSWPRGKA